MTNLVSNKRSQQPATLIIRLLTPLTIAQDCHGLDPEVHCLCYNAKGILIKESKQCLSLCAQYAPNAELYVLLALEDVFVSSVAIKSKKSAQLLKAAPFMLEEALATGIEDQHFALSKSDVDDIHPVVVLSKKKMQACLDLLQHHQLQASLVTVDLFLLPFVYSECSVLIDYNARALVRTGRSEGFCCSLAELNTLLSDVLESLSLQPETIHYACLDTALDEVMLDPETLGVHPEPLSSDALFMHLPVLKGNVPNLLQGDYLVSRNLTYKQSKWRYPISLLLLWLLLLSCSLQHQYRQLHETNEQAEANIKQLLAQYIEQPVQHLSAEQQLQDYLASRSKTADARRGFIDLLFSMMPQLIGHDSDRSTAVEIKQIIYRHGQLQIFITATDGELIEQLSHRLKSTAAQVEIDQLSIIDGISSARIQLYE